ncbi:MAG: nitronate monooxygenase [Chloroflexi bacterium]|nr:nitronate monooxygenase [Chloroflexota bacterium]
MKRTRVCQLLGIEYPIIQAGMAWISSAELAAAVSNAGALGVIIPNAGMSARGDEVKNLREQMKRVKRLTEKPFGVTFNLNLPNIQKLMYAAVEGGIRVAITSAGNPALYTSYLKNANVKVLHVVASVRHAKRAEATGVDAVIAEGYEAGGNTGFDELTTFVLVPQIVDAVEIPVIAAGGIADGRGFAAALALGADGIQIGTRFITTTECIAHRNVKEAIAKAIDTGTTVLTRSLTHSRVLKGKFVAKVLSLESEGAARDGVIDLMSAERARAVLLDGKLEDGPLYCGEDAGLITDVVGADKVVQDLVKGAEAILSSLK